MKNSFTFALTAVLSLTAGVLMAQDVQGKRTKDLVNEFSDAHPASTGELLEKRYFTSCQMVDLRTGSLMQPNAMEFGIEDRQVYAQIGDDVFGSINAGAAGSHRWVVPEGPVFKISDEIGKDFRSFEARKTEAGTFLFRETVDMSADHYDRIIACPGTAPRF